MADRGDSLVFVILVIDRDGEQNLLYLSDLAVAIFEEDLRKAGWDGESWPPPFIEVDLRVEEA